MQGNFDLYYGEVRLSPNFDLSPFFGATGTLNYGDLSDSTMMNLCSMALVNSGNTYNLYKRVCERGYITPILFKKLRALYHARRRNRADTLPRLVPAVYGAYGRIMKKTREDTPMKRILMIGTGGTIASGKTAEGLMPELTSEQLLSFVPAVSALCRAECLQLLSLDSTNLAPSHWLLIAKAIRERYDRYDGFVISHGTDTMAYTAAALSYLIQGARKPIILTGAQKPISFDSTDSKVNLTDAFFMRVQ